MIYVLALLIGVVAGLRTMTAPAVVSWAAHLGLLKLDGTPLAFLGLAVTSWILTVLAVVELVVDQLPSTPSRTVPMQFAARIISGAMTGGALGVQAGSLVVGAILGVVGAVIGTLGGLAGRTALTARIGARPAGFLEDAIAIGGALLIVAALR
jgi:Predicted membrane protein